MNCTLAIQEQFEGVINNWATTIFVSKLSLKTYHIIAYTTEKHYNRIYLRNLNKNSGEKEVYIQLGKSYAGNITGLEVHGKYLFVNLKYYKTVYVYDLELAIEEYFDSIC